MLALKVKRVRVKRARALETARAVLGPSLRACSLCNLIPMGVELSTFSVSWISTRSDSDFDIYLI